VTAPPLGLDGGFVPEVRRGLDVVTLAGETVIHHEGHIHALDPIATVVWQSIDGGASVDEIAAELADAFAIAPATARRDVTTKVAELLALDLLADPTVPARVPGSSPRLLVDPPGSCASCAEREWANRLTLRIDDKLVSVGTDSAAVATAVRRVLAAHLVTAPGPADEQPPFVAVTSPDAIRSAGPQPVHLLHRADVVLARTRHRLDVVRALVELLATYGDLAELGLATVRGLVVTGGERAVIVPVPEDLLRYRHELGRLGLRTADIPFAVVDPARAEVVVGAPDLEVGPAIEGLAPSTTGSATAPAMSPRWGRYPLVALGVAPPPTPAGVLLALGPDRGDHHDAAATEAALVSLIVSVPVVDALDPAAVAALLDRI
jgi:hypothetical protein